MKNPFGKRKKTALIGYMTDEKGSFQGKYLAVDGESLGDSIRDQFPHFGATEKLSDFLCSEHWQKLVGRDWSKPVVRVTDGEIPKDVPIGLGSTVTVVGSESKEWITSEDDLLFIDYLYLFVQGSEMAVYSRDGEGGWGLADTIAFKALTAS